MPAAPLSHGSKSFSASNAGIRSCTSATNLFGSVMIIVQDLSASPLARSRQSSQSPAIVSAGEPSQMRKAKKGPDRLSAVRAKEG
jgi:hypothetical protein